MSTQGTKEAQRVFISTWEEADGGFSEEVILFLLLSKSTASEHVQVYAISF